jgi:hypothetical protein
MISVHQLAEIISRSPKGTPLKQISRMPGKERYRGLCPFHHERTPSFDVFVGYDHAGHYFCQGCKEGGSAEWWLRKVDGKNIATVKPDAGLKRQRELQKRRAQIIGEFRDRQPECSVPDDFLEIT